MAYQVKKMCLQNQQRMAFEPLPRHKWQLRYTLLPISLLGLLVIYGSMAKPVKWVQPEHQEWQITSRIVAEQGLIWWEEWEK